MCPLFSCTDGNEVEFPWTGGTVGTIADAATKSIKVELVVEVAKNKIQSIPIGEFTPVSITIPAK